ncbi:Coenzyme F420 hydrogenase/dehydrogenase, beta subunit C-terminal domain [Sulfurospirillum barnesii]|uniref:Coenzyme F420-reducing hydrogenase, beta subunit n=1 Tax=Sulfurospirillum barnesii (strain ATCC 700032 / DSM 10660 / SES-3) TaxID=760154 RepID=I3XYX0_SULBS|nr:Coenzyme F420 hydrogenase/dehydrogenase, beta subunit C-terminal domain [Sulfurospirillum barnesii]AFL69144.1 coenzyme F420-reducing hydrogenase, beta subunit [Sulfurospirillum barnesii SES-3]
MPINIIDKKECNGCNACFDACSDAQAIRFEIDKEGFWYPKVDLDKCTDCGVCEKVCPELNADSPKLKVGKEPIVYAARHKDKEVIKDSTSGGVFTAFAELFYQMGGYVGGAVYDNDFNIKHIVTNDVNDLPKLRSSKYAQSDLTGFHASVKALLRKGEKVLVCGTPCQMAGLRMFLRKPYENLLILDFICRGINSPKVYQKHLNSLEKKFGSKINYLKAKNKELGWRSLTFKATFENGEAYYAKGRDDNYTRGYLQTGNITRVSCFDCKFKKNPRIADITMGDFWGVEKVAPELDDNLGTSLIMCNTDQGMNYFQALDNIDFKKVTIEDIIPGNRSLYQSVSESTENREYFFEDLDRYDFDYVTNKYFPKKKLSLKQKIRKIARNIVKPGASKYDLG